MSDLKRYFDDEMYYLRESGRQFAFEYPDSARFLDGDTLADRDPAVERLFEGFAFLTARIRQEMDQSESGLARDLAEIAAPELLEQLPSYTMAEIRPPRTETPLRTVETGALLSTGVIAGLGYNVLFSANNTRILSQTEIASVALLEAADGHDALEIQFERPASAQVRAEELPLYLQGESGLAWTLWYFLICCSEKGNSSKVEPYRVVQAKSSWDLCRNFFCMDEQFRFFKLSLPEFSGKLTIQIRFNRKFPRHLVKAVQRDTIRTNVFPLVNKFVQGTEPILLDKRHFEYRIVPRQGRRQELIRLRSVKAGNMKDPGRALEIPPFASPGVPDRLPGQLYYRTTTRLSRQGEASAWISLGQLPSDTEMLSLEALCCDGAVVREFVQAKDINQVKDPALAGCVVTALLRPSQMLRPPADQELAWRILGLLNAGTQSLANADALKRALALWQWDTVGSKSFLIEGIRKVTYTVSDRSWKGKLLPCIAVSVSLHDDKCQADSWDRLGLIHAFGSVLHELFIAQSTFNTLVTLEIALEPARMQMDWQAKEGACNPL